MCDVNQIQNFTFVGNYASKILAYNGLSDLNGRIQAFPFGDIESSKPTCITSVSLCSSDKKLKQSVKLHNS